MSYALESMKNDCKNCYKCIRRCPIKSISFEDNQASIIHEDCILCGTCYLACPQKAKVIRDDLKSVKEMIKNKEKVICSLAPSFISNFEGTSIKTMKDALLKLGFSDVEETAIGATIVKRSYDEMLENDDRDIVISSCCHAINLLIEKHYPDLLKYLADVLSPMQAHAKDIKNRIKDSKVVFVGPCIAKKDESDKSFYVDKALTFIELDSWLKEENITIEAEKDNAVIEESKARLFPTSGGILRTMEKANKGYTYLEVSGIENAIDALESIRKGHVHHCFIEMSSCYGSCINGPAILPDARRLIKGYLDVNNFAGNKDFKVSNMHYKDIKNTYINQMTDKKIPTEEEIKKCFIEMGKLTKEQELNCGSCGYNTCREKAIAILQGKAIKEMCLPFLMEKASSISDKILANSPNGVIVVNDNLEIQLINKKICSILGLSNQTSLVGTKVDSIMDPKPFNLALLGNEVIKEKVHVESLDKFLEITAAYDKKFNIVIAIVVDITKEEKEAINRSQKLEKTIEITDTVIKENMRSVQEIASLLGETAAQTKTALSKLQEELKNDKE